MIVITNGPHSRLWKNKLYAFVFTQAVANDGKIIICTVSQAYHEFLNNWLVSLAKQNRHQSALIIAEDYATLDFVNSRWPGHAVLVPPAPSSSQSLPFGSQVSRYVGLEVGSPYLFVYL